LLDVESVAGHLLKPGSVFTFLAQHRSRLFPPELFTDLFPTRQGAAIRRVARDVPGADEMITGAATSGHDYSRPGKPQIAWDDPAARDELVSVLGGRRAGGAGRDRGALPRRGGSGAQGG
jgi:hypothetical protein